MSAVYTYMQVYKASVVPMAFAGAIFGCYSTRRDRQPKADVVISNTVKGASLGLIWPITAICVSTVSLYRFSKGIPLFE